MRPRQKKPRKFVTAKSGTYWSTRSVSYSTLSFIPRNSGPRWRLALAAPGATTIPFIEHIFAGRRIHGTQDGDDGVAHWCLELANR